MCDEFTENDNDRFFQNGGRLNRRDFNGLSAAGVIAAMFPANALANDTVVEKRVDVEMPEGVSDCFFAHPAEGQHAAVLMWPDIRGLRPAFEAMGKRLASAGYSVLVVNPFYRDAKAPVVGPDASFSDPDTRTLLRGMASKLTQDASMSDARAYISFLDRQDSVDVSRKIGTAGYCMGGPLIMRTAAAAPDRVGAAASFHGGGLATDSDDSPHLLIPETTAQVLHAIAENDDERSPDTKTVLAEAYKSAGLEAEIEVYQGTLHGWCPPDSRVYNEQQAEKAWARMLALFERALS
ncbi:MAG: dienelactone hydrolase family protein [Pseudomonadota bacterium]